MTPELGRSLKVAIDRNRKALAAGAAEKRLDRLLDLIRHAEKLLADIPDDRALKDALMRAKLPPPRAGGPARLLDPKLAIFRQTAAAEAKRLHELIRREADATLMALRAPRPTDPALLKAAFRDIAERVAELLRELGAALGDIDGKLRAVAEIESALGSKA